jgi:ligand-binding sensor domain-containing protein
MRRFFVLVFLFFLMLSSSAQQFWYKSYTSKDGLSSNEVQTIFQDEQGFLWIGTSNGLNRFDGNVFDNFYNDPTDSTSIRGNDIQCIFQDSKKRMWIATNEGISLYNPLMQQFCNYSPDTLVLPYIGTTFPTLCDDENGKIWVGTKNELLVFDPVSKKFSRSGWADYAENVAPANDNHLRVVVLGLVKKGKNELWILSTYGLFSVNTLSRKFQYYPYNSFDDFYGCQLQYADEKGNVWISLFGEGILCYNSQNGTWTNYHSYPSYSSWDNAFCIKEYSGDTLMYSSANTVIFFSKEKRKIIGTSNYYPSSTKPLKDFRCPYIMRQGNFLWMATNTGLVKMIPRQKLFTYDTLAGPTLVNRIYRSNYTGNLVYGGEVQSFIQLKNNVVRPITNTTGSQLSSAYQYFAEDREGNAYLNEEEHFYVYDQVRNIATPVPLPLKRFPGNLFTLRNMVIDKEGTVWIRSLGQGIIKYQPKTREIEYAPNLPISKNKQISSLYYDSLTHSLLISQEFDGVMVYDIKKQQVQHHLLNADPSQRGAAILCVTGDGKGTAWMSNLDAGIFEYNNVSRKFARYTSKDGLLSDKAAWVCLDGKGFLWIATDRGLSRMDTATKRFTNFPLEEGYPSTSANFLSRDGKGIMYMPYDKGYYSWSSNSFANAPNNGTIYLRRAQLPDKKLPLSQEYQLSYSENNLQFLFGWLTLENTAAPNIEYRLNDNPWLTTDLHSIISFANLAPQHYNLYVRTKNNPASVFHISFNIAYPFWKKWWFLLLVILSIAAIVVLIVRARLNAVRRESLLKHQVIESQMSALRSQMNPHFVFNTLNSINSYIIENRSQQASDYLTDFSRLMRIIHEHSRKQLVTLDEEMRALKLYLELESKRLDGSFDYRIELDSAEAPGIKIPPLIIQPFVENAIWHGLRNKQTTGFIEIKVHNNGKGLQIAVTDNGIGRVAAGKQQKLKGTNSFGTTSTIQRISLADPTSKVIIDDLYNESGEATGTRVNIFLNQKNK